MFGRNKNREVDEVPTETAAPPTARTASSSSDAGTLTDDIHGVPSKAQIKRATRTRFYWTLFSSFCLLVSVIFLILVNVGNTHVGTIVNNIYFININVSNIIPVSVPDAAIINSIAQTIGLRDFYTVGLWSFCQGYNGVGTTECSDPTTLFWFNPVEILSSQLIAGATIALPDELLNILDLIEIVSNIMFGFFLTAACVNFLMMFLLPLAIYSRWVNLPITIMVFLGALITTAGAIVATVMFIIFQNAITSADQLNIQATLGVQMFVFMWIAAGASIIAWLVHMGMCCCCASRRDVRKGKKRGSEKAYQDTTGIPEHPTKTRRGLPTFGRTPREIDE